MRIITALPLAAAILFASPALARDNRPVACIYSKSMRVKRPDLLALVRSGFRPVSGDEKNAMTILGDSVTVCRAQYGWAEKKQGIALRYLSATVLREDAVYQGKKFGLTDEMLAGLVGTLDAAGRAAYLAGQPGAALSTAAFAYLKNAGLVIDSLAPEDSATVNHAIAEGVTGIIAQQDAEKEYAA
ncbi:MAG: hypothetical protein JWM65_749 [Sphingomonas bacterium]|nr:hypothetical protein [Sphingomonas bacterium]